MFCNSLLLLKMVYYGDLSGNSSSSSSSSSSEEEVEGGGGGEYGLNLVNNDDDLWSRCILHLDIDCFYCQAEELDRKLSPLRPLAIGQKHIIVTCNYAARQRGVQKLQLREAAMSACPDLLIVEGSDLKSYKQHSRFVYEAFRKAAKDINPNICCKKGTMDEMMADLSPAVNDAISSNRNTSSSSPLHYKTEQKDWSLFVFGQSKTNTTTKLIEDQTGQETVVSFHINTSRTLPSSRRNVHDNYGTERDRNLCIRRLEIASFFVERICNYIRESTGFYCTGGVSVSPLLAKLASDLNKPKSINLLYPWRSSPILYSMPLRKLQNVGSRTMRALETSMGQHVASLSSHLEFNRQQQQQDTTVKTVLDLLRVPHTLIVKSLETLQTGQGSSTERCDLLLQRCRGLDTTDIVDDDGLLPKTVSVENSFRRGTICSRDLVWRAMDDDLLQRLPLLLNDRTSWSVNPHVAFPNTIRMTVRFVDMSLLHSNNNNKRRRRPFVTKSKQRPIPLGRSLVEETDPTKQSLIIKRLVQPLLEELLLSCKDINVTRLNIALTNFQDVLNHHKSVSTGQAYSLLGTISQSPMTQKARSNHDGMHKPAHASTSIARKKTSRPQISSGAGKKRSSAKMKATRIDSFFQQKKKKT